MSSVAISTFAPAHPHAVNRGRFALASLGTVAAAVLANVLVYAGGSALVGYDPRFLPLATVNGTILFTLVPALVATLLYAVLLRFAGNPARTFAIVATVVFVVTLIPDFTYIPAVPGATAGQTAILVLMHVVAVGVIISMLTALAHPQSR